nr:MAG TPA: hypothetical protein [Caudoviricetes sp.]
MSRKNFTFSKKYYKIIENERRILCLLGKF